MIFVCMCIEVISTVLRKKYVKCSYQSRPWQSVPGSLRVNTRDSRLYRILSIRRPRRLFQTWPGGAGVYLTPAVY